MFRLTILVVVAGLQILVYRKVRRWAADRFPGRRMPGITVDALFSLFGAGLLCALFLGFVTSHIPGWMLALLARPFYIWEGATVALGLVILIGILLGFPFRLAGTVLDRLPLTGPGYRRVMARPGVAKFDATRRAFLVRGMEGMTAVSLGASAYGVFEGRTGYDCTETRITIPGLPVQLEGFTIGLLSDIHSSSFMTKKQMDGYCAGVMGLGTDLIVVPGDFVNSQTEEVYPFAESFSALHAPCGVFGVMGNHDFYAPDPERVAREVDACGVKLLRNDSVILQKNGARLALIGIDDVGRPDRALSHMESALRGVPDPLPRVLLCHRPYFVDEAAAMGMDVVLSGHTHGGQIVLGHIGGVTLTPAALASPYVWGKYTRGRTQMYVSRGIGTVGLPMRINCPPEITRITLSGAEVPPPAGRA